MFEPITLPYGAKMLFNTVKLRPGVAFEDVELAVGEMCNVVKETYGGDKGGFLAGPLHRIRLGRGVAEPVALGRRAFRDRHLLALVRGAREVARRRRVCREVRRAGDDVLRFEGARLRDAVAGGALGAMEVLTRSVPGLTLRVRRTAPQGRISLSNQQKNTYRGLLARLLQTRPFRALLAGTRQGCCRGLNEMASDLRSSSRH